MKLTDTDIPSLKALFRLGQLQTSSSDHERVRLHRIKALEETLSDQAKVAWFQWSSTKFRKELSRWKKEFFVEKTRRGYRATRWVKCRKQYAVRPTAAALSLSEVKRFSSWIRI